MKVIDWSSYSFKHSFIPHFLASSNLFNPRSIGPLDRITPCHSRRLSINSFRPSSSFAFLIGVASADGIVQKDPIDISKTIRAVGTSFISAKDGGAVTIDIPKGTEPGDVLVLYVGGSASGKKMPSRPGNDWTIIFEEGKEDLNLKAYYKIAEPNDFIDEQPSIEISTADNIFDFSLPEIADSWKISGGKNTFVSIISLRGIDTANPVVDFGSDEDTESGREGDARAPSVRTEKEGVVVFAAAFDDPHQAVVSTKGFVMLLSTDSGTGDGLAIGISPTNGDRTGSIDATGTSYERGGGDDIASAISFRAMSAPLSSQEEQSDDELDTNTLFAVRLAPLVDVRLDPIVNPDTCSSHVHSVFGAASFGKTISDADLQNSIETSSNVLPNKSLYWAPSMYIFDPHSQLYNLVPTYARAYYRFNDRFLQETKPFPLNFRVVVGDARRKSKFKPGEARDDISWTQKGSRRDTNSQDHSSWDEYIEAFGYRTDPEEYLEMNVNFPECCATDNLGRPLLDSKDHRSHMTYVDRNADPCPASHPYRVPKINLEVRYELDRMVDSLGKDVVQNPSNWFLSTGDHSGAGAHADFISGWDEHVLEEAIRDCRGGNAESGCILTSFFSNSRAEDRAKRVELLKENEFPGESVSPIKQLIVVPDGSCSTPVSTSTPSVRPSIRPSARPSSKPSSNALNTLIPTIAPSRSTRLCNTAKEARCRSKCFARRECGSNLASSCHSVCRHKCCNYEAQQDESRLCNTPTEKECRSKCFHNQSCNADESCKTQCRQRCCSADRK